jgi:hypothetical protein
LICNTLLTCLDGASFLIKYFDHDKNDTEVQIQATLLESPVLASKLQHMNWVYSAIVGLTAMVFILNATVSASHLLDHWAGVQTATGFLAQILLVARGLYQSITILMRSNVPTATSLFVPLTFTRLDPDMEDAILRMEKAADECGTVIVIGNKFTPK